MTEQFSSWPDDQPDLFASPDYRLDGFTAATEEIEDYFHRATLDDSSFVLLAAHHSGDSYLLFHDPTYIYDVPGTASYVAMHLTRDTEQRTYRFAEQKHPLSPLAQRWLVQRGCPPTKVELSDAGGPRAADALEELLRANTDDRYEVLDHHTGEVGDFSAGMETWVMVRDAHPDSAQFPYRIFLEEVAPSLTTYTVREAAFPTAEAADNWVWDRDRGWPAAPEPAAVRAEAAVARSPRAPGRLAVPPNPVTAPHPSVSSETARTGRGRS
ncbi:hypothetical protein [Streptomyces clavuligerus]|uniref:Uncharacterized protein n=1 Tax=Streptomyces clavuligerus TaxID=1901 RepID=B5GPJ6_STRCL|nr:hypothetical protein [Streptomyces clavuligerus]ANW19616.1 hypothetical protein BB341_16005 [Streptomyces clavuligerus]AXU14222.1 hypothetical protein D1794_16690 [Streptomyces clavuligerus]EDY48242.1 conserved hypothetical protein [Streptomyces clavuligerus]EFG07565.1 Hypothetical protein SCLAV_2492 [Streptomyces clavuligerus]MBY6304222.1 hypothetical protein [Streptomyces clavuligerus]